MEKIVNIHIEKLPEGFYLATSDSINGLIAQGRTVIETLEIARDVARKLIEAQRGSNTADIEEPLAVNEVCFAWVVGFLALWLLCGG